MNEIFQKYPDLLSVQDLSEIFQVSRNAIYKEIKSGKFGEPIKIGREFRISKVFVWNAFICYNNCEGNLASMERSHT